MAKRLRPPIQTTNDQERKWKIAFDQNPSPAIFKLHAIACYELFNYLEFSDIESMGQTCKRFYRIGGTYFQENWIRSRYHSFDDSRPAFSQYIQSVGIDYTKKGIEILQRKWESLKKIKFEAMTQPILIISNLTI